MENVKGVPKETKVAPKLSDKEFYEKQLENKELEIAQWKQVAQGLEKENINLINSYSETLEKVKAMTQNVQTTLNMVLPDFKKIEQSLNTVKNAKIKQQEAVKAAQEKNKKA